MTFLMIMSFMTAWSQPMTSETVTHPVPEDLVMFGVTADRVKRKGLKKDLVSNRLWIYENGQWIHPWSFHDKETDNRWNLFVSIDRAVAYGNKIAFTAIVNHPRKPKFGLFLYEPHKDIRPLMLFDISTFMLKKRILPEPYASMVSKAYVSKLSSWEASHSKYKSVYNKVFSRTYFKHRAELSPIGWLADGQTVLLWRPKKLLFVPINGEPPQLVELKNLRKQVPDWQGDRFRVAFGHQTGVAPVLANNENMFQIQNDKTLIPWQQRAANARLGIEKHRTEWNGSPFGDAAPERLEVLSGGQYFLWEQQILSQHLTRVWDLGGGKPVVKMAGKQAVAAVAYPGKRTIKVRNLETRAEEQIFKFKPKIFDMALNDTGDLLAVAVFGKQKRKFVNDLELIDLKTGDRKRVGLNFLPYLQSLNEKVADQTSRMAFSIYYLEKDFKKHGFFPKIFAMGDYFYFKSGRTLTAVNREGIMSPTDLEIHPALLWDAFADSRPLFPDYRRFMKLPEGQGFSFSINF